MSRSEMRVRPVKPPVRQRDVRTAMDERLPPCGILVLESHHSPQFTMRPRTHAFLKVIFVLEGAGRIVIDDSPLDFSAGDVIVVPSGATNCIFDGPDTPASLYVGCVGDRVLQCEPALRAAFSARVDRGPNRSTTAVAATLRRMMFAQHDSSGTIDGIDLMIDAWRLVRLVVDGKSRQDNGGDKPSGPGLVDDETAIIRDYVAGLPHSFLEATSIDAAAASVGLSRRTFTRLFRQATGTTWLQHVRTLAIDHAAGLLRQTDLPITSIAFESGFSDLSTFYRRFRSQQRCSPAAYRRSRR